MLKRITGLFDTKLGRAKHKPLPFRAYQDKGIESLALSKALGDFCNRFRNDYSSDTLMTFVALGPMQTFIGFLVDEGYIEIVDKYKETDATNSK